MIEPFTYLYYRCYKLYAKKNEPPAFQHAVLFGMMVFFSITAVITLAIGDFPSLEVNYITMLITMGLVILVTSFEKQIVQRYDNMNERKKMIGNIVFIVEIMFVISSLLVILLL